MNKIYSLLLLAAASMGFTSCWQEEDYEAGKPRHQVEDLTAIPGDEEVLLTWTMPQGWNPSTYAITYTNDLGEDILINTTDMNYLVTSLQNGYDYKFTVQAVYGTLISQGMEVKSTPATTRFPITDLTAEGSSETIYLTWTQPGTSVTGYILKYYPEATPADAQEVNIDATATDYTITGLTNDINYIVEMTAVYPKGNSETVSARVMPADGIPYILESEYAVVGQLVKFTFNFEDYPDATDITWTFPGDQQMKGSPSYYAFTSANPETKVVLSANTGHRVQSWDIYLNVRDYAVYSTVWEQDGTAYNGFKGTCPVFSPDGNTVYIITFNKVASLSAFDIVTGERRWVYRPTVNAGSYNMLTVNPVNGDIYYGTQTAGQFYCVTETGELRWIFTGAQSMQSAAPAVNKAGTVVYIVDNTGQVFAIDAAGGAQIWKQTTTGSGAGLIVNGSELVVGNVNKTAVNFLNIADGSVITSLSLGANMVQNSGFAVAADGKRAYVPHAGGGMSLIDLDAHKALVTNFMIANNDLYEPVVAPNGDVFVGSKNSSCYIVDGGLTAIKHEMRVAQLAAGVNNGYNFSHPVVDDQNRYMITSGQVQNQSIIINASGTILEQWTYGDANQKQMGGNNFLNGYFFSAFIGASGNNGIFVGKCVGGNRAAGWSTHGGDQCGSCCLK